MRTLLFAALGLGLTLAACQGNRKPPAAHGRKVHPPLRAASSTVARTACDLDALRPTSHTLESEPGIRVSVTSMRGRAPRRGAIVLTHGAGSPSSSIWDLHVEDYSLMRRLACEGFDSYALDVRGFGASSKPPPGPDGVPGPVRAKDVLPDVRAAVAFAQKTSNVERVDLLGWSWGCVVSGLYAGAHPEDLRRLVLFAPVYDKKWPTRHAKAATWKVVDRKLFSRYHDPRKESGEVLELHVQKLFAHADPDGELRLSNGPYFDIYGEGGPIWDPRAVRAPTLVLRGEDDRASEEGPAYRLFTHLDNAADRRYVVLPDAGHFAFRTYRYRAFADEVLHFLTTEVIEP